jgi:hypothetical protein
MNFSWCKSPDVGLPRPDLVCFLSVSEQAALARADFGTERYEKIEFQNKVSTAAPPLGSDNSAATTNEIEKRRPVLRIRTCAQLYRCISSKICTGTPGFGLARILLHYVLLVWVPVPVLIIDKYFFYSCVN